MLHGVGHIDELAIDARLFERAIEQPAGGTHERPPGSVLLIARLLAEEDGARGVQAFAEDGLRSAFVQIAGRAGRRRGAQGRQ